MAFSFGGFCSGVSAAIVVKFTCSIDNVLWLSAFLTPKLSHEKRTQNVLIYAFVCLCQTCLAFFIPTFGEEVMARLLGNNEDRMSTDRILTLISASALLVYSIVLAKEYYDKKCGGEEYSLVQNSCPDNITSSEKVHYMKEKSDEDENDVKPNPQDVEVGNILIPLEIEDGTDSIDISSDQEKKEKVEDESPQSGKESQSLAVIASLGSLDDLALLVSMLVGKRLGFVELIIGSMISTFAIVFTCLFVTKCKLVADLLEKIPLMAIVTAFSVALLTKGIFFMD